MKHTWHILPPCQPPCIAVRPQGSHYVNFSFRNLKHLEIALGSVFLHVLSEGSAGYKTSCPPYRIAERPNGKSLALRQQASCSRILARFQRALAAASSRTEPGFKIMDACTQFRAAFAPRLYSSRPLCSAKLDAFPAFRKCYDAFNHESHLGAPSYAAISKIRNLGIPCLDIVQVFVSLGNLVVVQEIHCSYVVFSVCFGRFLFSRAS